MDVRIEVGAYLEKLMSFARQQRFTIDIYGHCGQWPLVGMTRTASAPDAPHVYVSAGIHGDEPAGPLMLLHCLESDWFGLEQSWTICPLLNPWSIHYGRREGSGGWDLNRDYILQRSMEVAAHVQWLKQRTQTFDVAVCLHEDWEFEGFYLYAYDPSNGLKKAQAAIHAVRRVCPIHNAQQIDHRNLENGIVDLDIQKMQVQHYEAISKALVALEPYCPQLPQSTLYQQLCLEYPGLFSELYYLLAHQARSGYILEAPSSRPLGERIGALSAALKCLI